MVNQWIKDHPALVSGVLLGAGAVGAFMYHNRTIALSTNSSRLLRAVKGARRNIHVVNNEREWQAVLPELRRECRKVGAVGFDCEWVQVRGRRRPVALVQLATCSGLCVLVRLCRMKADIPQSFRAYLEDETILKVGVGPIEDSRYLTVDYNLQVNGCVDLRYLVKQSLMSDENSSDSAAEEKSTGGLGLNSLAQKYLGRTLDKDWRVRASDWEAETLTRRQESYAAEDALVGIHILMTLMTKLWAMGSLMVPYLPSALWYNHLYTAIHEVCADVRDIKFSTTKKDPESASLNVMNRAKLSLKPKTNSRAYTTRIGPLYHNCQLRAPDDQPLCTIDPKKARWYVEKNLGVLVSEEPLVVRLKFEPAGRPQMEMEDGQFYLQERQNLCVVCGKDQSYIRKNVVPHDYRKYFPPMLKSHQNHDVVLLCVECHRQSNIRDNLLRLQLAKEFDAPIGTEQDVKSTVDKNLKTVRYAAGALLKQIATIPEKRVKELETIVKNFYNVENVTEQQLVNAANMDVKVWNESYHAHGHKVYEAYQKVGLVKLEQRWRQHFLTSMKPKHMPDCWSLTHNEFKMRVKMARLPPDHPDREVYKIILVGTEGTIDIPYDPTLVRRPTPDDTTDSSSNTSREVTPESEFSITADSEITPERELISKDKASVSKATQSADEDTQELTFKGVMEEGVGINGDVIHGT